MKKILAAFVAVLLVLSLSVVAFAADSTDVSYFTLSKAAEDISFEYNGVTQESDRIFYKIDGVYYLYYFSPISGTTNGGTAMAVKAFYYFKYDGVKWMTEGYSYYGNEFGALPSPSLVAYSEKDYKVGSLVVNDNVSSLTRGLRDSVDSRDLIGIWQTIKPLLPVVAVAVVGFLAFRKGWSFLKGEAASA